MAAGHRGLRLCGCRVSAPPSLLPDGNLEVRGQDAQRGCQVCTCSTAATERANGYRTSARNTSITRS